MKVILRNGKGKVRLADFPDPSPEPGEVILDVAACGVCGSDISRFKGTDALDREQYDQIPFGHEFCGTVAAVGESLSENLIGRSFAVAPLVPCHECAACEAGEYVYCERGYSFIGTRRPGALAERVAVPGRNLIELPAGMDVQTACGLEPLAVVLQGLHRVSTRDLEGGTAIVTGMGPIGLLAVQELRRFGVKNIIATHTGEARLQMAREMGATHTAVTGDAESLKAIVKQTGLAPLIVECAGSGKALEEVLPHLKPHGDVVLVGKLSNPSAQAFGEAVMRKQAHLHGTFMSHEGLWPGDAWHEALKLLATGQVQYSSLIDKSVSLAEAAEVIGSVLEHGAKFIKVLVRPQG